MYVYLPSERRQMKTRLLCWRMMHIDDMLPRILIRPDSIRSIFVTLNEITLINLP